jgi:alcohol dehydrogenase class IV
MRFHGDIPSSLPVFESPVLIYEYDRIEGKDLFGILRKSAGLEADDKKELSVSVISDKTSIAERDRIIKSLNNFCKIIFFDQVEPNPKTSDIMAMFKEPAFKETGIVLGIGGGSVLDSAKALAMLAANGGDLEDYLGQDPRRTITKTSLPLTLIPTTAGTGSEVTKVGVYTSFSGRKYTLGSFLMMAQSAVLSGSLLEGIPSQLCASTGFDALDHALESIWNKNALPHTRKIAEKAAVEVMTWLPLAYQNTVCFKNGEILKDSIMVNQKMLRASCLAGTAFNITGTAAGHALSFVLSEDWHTPHGTACAFTLPDIFDLSLSEEETLCSLERIGGELFPAAPDPKSRINHLRNRIIFMMEEMKIPKTFSDLGINLKPENIDAHFSRSFLDPKMLNQIPKAAKKNIAPILERQCEFLSFFRG